MQTRVIITVNDLRHEIKFENRAKNRKKLFY